jgi:la-related protein 1
MNPYAAYGAYGNYTAQHMYAAAAAMQASQTQTLSGSYAPGVGSMMGEFAAAVNPTPTDKLPKDNKKAVRKQIEYYFSNDNLVKDIYFRNHMDDSGYVDLTVITAFNLVAKHGATIKAVADVVSDSKTLELSSDSKKVRLKDEEERTKWLNKA